MRRESAHQMLKETPPETKQFVKRYADIVVRINQLLRQNNMTQANLAEKMGKKPSEISRWLSGEHNLTLLSICKLEVELGGDIIHVPRPVAFASFGNNVTEFVVYTNDASIASSVKFTDIPLPKKSNLKQPVAIAS